MLLSASLSLYVGWTGVGERREPLRVHAHRSTHQTSGDPLDHPPLAQLLFRVVHHSARGVVVIAADSPRSCCWRRHGALAYATCPLVLFEGTWSAHTTCGGVLLAFARLRGSAVAAGLAAGLKMSSRGRAGPARMKHRFVALALTLLLPFLPFLGGPIMPGFHDYATRWIFNSPLYALVRAVVELIPTKSIWTHHPLRFQFLSDVVYRHLYPDFLTRAILAVIAIGAILTARRVTTAVAALLICSPAIPPGTADLVPPRSRAHPLAIGRYYAAVVSADYGWGMGGYVAIRLASMVTWLAPLYGPRSGNSTIPPLIAMRSLRRFGRHCFMTGDRCAEGGAW